MTPEDPKPQIPQAAKTPRRPSPLPWIAKVLLFIGVGMVVIPVLVFGTCLLLYAR